MPTGDWFADNAPGQQSQAPPPQSGGGDWFAQNAPKQGPASRFFSNLYDSTVGGAVNAGKQLVKADMQDPLFGVPKAIVGMGANAARAQAQTAGKAVEAVRKGDYGNAPGYALSAAAPVIGPALANAHDQAASGDVAGAAGNALGTVASFAGPELASRLPAVARIRGIVKNVNNPTEEAALSQLEQSGVPMSAGQRTGNRGLQRVEQGLENFPGSSTAAHDFKANQQQALAGEFDNLAQQAGPPATDAVGAGEAVQGRLGQRVNRLKAQADNLYDQVRQTTSANKMAVQGPPQNSPILQSNGQPFQTQTAQVFETPIDLQPIRASLGSVYEEMQRLLPDAKKAASPAYQSLKNLMESPQQYMNAMDFDKTLSALKSITRDGSNPYLSNASQGLAKYVIKNGERELQSTLGAADPSLPGKLRSARNVYRSYYDTADFLNDLRDEPATVYQNLVSGGDRVYNKLQTLQKIAPNEVNTVGRTFLEGLIEKATSEGGFGRSQGILADWNRLGQRTKQMMYGQQLTDELDNFFLGAKRLTTERNPSGSAHMVAALGNLGIVGSALTEFVTGAVMGHPGAGAAGAASTAGALYGGPKILANALLSPGGVRTLTQGLGIPARAPIRFGAQVNRAGQLANPQQPTPYAVGGVVNQPTDAVIGEAGPEMRVPLGGTVPEDPRTLSIQMGQLQNGQRRAVLFPRGTPIPERPDGLKQVSVRDGMLYYQPGMVKPSELISASKTGRLNDVLGAADGGMGPQSKGDIAASGQTPLAVIGKAADGTTAQGTLASPDQVAPAVAQTAKVTPPGGRVAVENPKQEILRRIRAGRGKRQSGRAHQAPQPRRGA